MPIEHMTSALPARHWLVLRAPWACVLLVAILALGSCATQAPRATQANETPFAERQRTAMAMFAERCKRAGEFIHRVAENVDGILLMNVRPVRTDDGQFALFDPYGHDFEGDAYIRSFLRGHYGAGHTGTPIPGAPPPPRGYRYVEAIDPKDGIRYRYTGSMKSVERTWSVMNGGDGKTKYTRVEFVAERTPSNGVSPRYGLIFKDISTREEREHWIAGSSLKVIDLATGDVMAERVGYLVDPLQGSLARGRDPWLHALDYACPALVPAGLGPASADSPYRAARFAERIAIPRKD